MNAAVIVNPVSGQGRAKKFLPEIMAELEAAGLRPRVYLTEQEGQATQYAANAVREGSRLVIAAGGDGTVSEIINGIARTDVRLGVIPAGTGDVLAKELGIPAHRPLEACKIIIKGKTKQIDLGQADERHFVLMAGIGFDAQVVKEVDPKVKRLLKDLAYPLTGIKTLLTYKPSPLNITFDGRSTEGYFVVIGNARYYGGRFSITRQGEIDDGLLDVCVFKGNTTASFVRYVEGVITGTHLRFGDVDYYKAKHISVLSETPVFVQTDGEVIGKTPMEFSIAPQALTVLVP